MVEIAVALKTDGDPPRDKWRPEIERLEDVVEWFFKISSML